MHLRDFQRRLAKRVRVLREEHHVRQEDLEDFGLAWKTIQKIEYEKTDPKVSTLLKLSSAFELSLIDLLRPLENSGLAATSRAAEAPSPPYGSAKKRRSRIR